LYSSAETAAQKMSIFKILELKTTFDMKDKEKFSKCCPSTTRAQPHFFITFESGHAGYSVTKFHGAPVNKM